MPGPASAAQSPSGTVRFAGLTIHPMTVDQTVQALAGRPADAPFAVYVTPNVEHIYLRRKNAELGRVMDGAAVSSNDSRILHRLARLAGLELQFAPGAYVVDRLFKAVIGPRDAILVIGATPDVAEDLRRRFSLTGLVQHIPPMGFIHDEKAVAAAVDIIADHPSRFVMVAMGPPQSEILCHRVMLDGRATGIGLCIGSSLNVLTGKIERAPDWMENTGFVWLHRLAREPRRLFRRYMVHDMYGLLVCLREILAWRLGLRKRALA